VTGASSVGRYPLAVISAAELVADRRQGGGDVSDPIAERRPNERHPVTREDPVQAMETLAGIKGGGPG
jgi:hypothetical protein